MRNFPALLSGTLLLLAPAFSQDRKEPVNRTVYRVEFNIRDGNPGASKSGRRYTMLVEADGRAIFRNGNKVPYITGGSQSGNAATLVNAQYNYAEIGVNIDCRLHEVNAKVSLSTSLEISAVAPNERVSTGLNPTIAMTRVDVTTELEPGKPAIISTVDDPVTQRKIDIEAVATKVI